jgi:predicted transcriptional regulator
MTQWGSDPTAKRRDKLFIVAEILEIAKGGTLKTQIMYRGNLSFTQLNEYLDFMLKIEILEKIKINDKDVYRATAKGLDFLQRYRDITELLRSEDDTHCKNHVKIPPAHLLKRN